MAAEAKQPLLDASIEIDGIDLSQVSNEVEIDDSAAEHDVTGFQGGGYTEDTPGLKTAVINVKFFQGYEEGGVHETLKPLYDSGEPFVVKIKPDDAAVSKTNPQWEMTCKLYGYKPIGAQVGNPQEVPCTFKNASSAGLVEKTE